MSFRDRLEFSLIKEATKMNIPVIGICRGAQLLCAMAGGSLFQHVTGHFGSHSIITDTNRELETNSLHHQMMNLENVEHKLIAWCPEKLSKTYIGDGGSIVNVPVDFKEPEVCWIPKMNGLCIQGHPEFYSQSNEFVEYVLDLTKEYILK